MSRASGPRAALGLYSMREHFEREPAGTLARVADLGFRLIEPYAVAQFADRLPNLLSDAGLSAPVALAGPRGVPATDSIAGAAAVGATTLIIPGSDPELWTSMAGLDSLIAELTVIADTAAAAGVSIGYHNHDFEVRTRIAGAPALEYFASHLPDNVVLEVDVYWLERGGARAVDFLFRHGDRVRFLHVKDASAGRDGGLSDDVLDQVPAGEGIIAWGDVLRAAPQVEAAIVEFDEYRDDVFAAAGRALRTLEQEGAVA